jgi:hypothetical protein
VNALAERFLFALPRIYIESPEADNWQRSAWQPQAPQFGKLPVADENQHFG